MIFEPIKLSKIIEQNYTHLMPDFFKMQTEYLASLKMIYNDLDASLIAMLLTSEFYKNIVRNNDNGNYSLKNFYRSKNYETPISVFKIKEISSIINLPRETVRRKREKLIKDKLIILSRNKKFYSLNSEIVQEKILRIQIENLSRFLARFSLHFTKNKFFLKQITSNEIKIDIESKFLLYLPFFLDFQISYFSKLKTLVDIESGFIVLLCALNTITQIKNKNEPMDVKNALSHIHALNKTLGLNVTSIADITNVPRTTVLRKIDHLVNIGILRRDKFKRYTHNGLSNMNDSKNLLSIIDHNIKILSIFFSQCLNVYKTKS
tara:strand:- start:810 stop:1769 length:960 start_codon:yes stop_codon:yes gene_type:complete